MVTKPKTSSKTASSKKTMLDVEERVAYVVIDFMHTLHVVARMGEDVFTVERVEGGWFMTCWKGKARSHTPFQKLKGVSVWPTQSDEDINRLVQARRAREKKS